MKLRRTGKTRDGAFKLIALLGAVLAAASSFGAIYNETTGYVRLLANNSGNAGESTFMTNILRSSYGWSDLSDPHSGTNYYCGYQLCTPKVANGSYTFQGDRLVMAAALRALRQAGGLFVRSAYVQTVTTNLELAMNAGKTKTTAECGDAGNCTTGERKHESQTRNNHCHCGARA